MGKKQINLNDLPQFNSWIPYLLGIKKLDVSLDKNIKSIQREYGDEKWGVLLNKINKLNNPTIFDADRLFIGDKEIPFFFNAPSLHIYHFLVFFSYNTMSCVICKNSR